MAKDGQTIRVCGLPTDINENRLSDKLYIHFLRKRNGGGDISSVTVPKSTPGSALITFEDSEVAQRVITQGNHTLSVNDKQYVMTVSLHQKEMNPDELFIDIAVTVDYNKLPGGKAALSDIRSQFPDIKLNFDPQDNLCILRGRYSEVQTLTKSLLSGINSNNAQDVHYPKPEATSDQKRCHSSKGRMESQRESESSGQACGLDLSKCSSSTSERSRTPPHTSYTNYSEVPRALEEGPPLEDFSMIIDTDIFRYLQHCSVEYQSILERHGVEILDVTTKDITTLFLQAGAGGTESIERAYVELGWLYQEKEAQLRKVHLPKEGLHIQQLQQAIEVLTQTFPKLLINEDKANVYLVGSGSSVSEAKQFLMDMGPNTDVYNQDKNKPSNVIFKPSGASSLSYMPDKHSRTRGTEQIKTPKLVSTFGKDTSFDKSIIDKDFSFSSLDEAMMPEGDQMHPSWSTRPKDNDGQRFDSGLTSEIMGLKVQPTIEWPKDLSGPEDTLCKRNKPLSTASMKSPTPPSFVLSSSNRAKNAANVSASQSYSLDYTPPLSIAMAAPTDSDKLSKSESILKKTNSFSGWVRGEDGRVSTSDVDMVNSLNSSETKEVFSDEVTLPTAQWVYMKEKYRTQIENLTTDLQMRKSGTGAGKEVILHLKGADVANGRKTHQVLEELVAKVAKDFLTEELPLVHLSLPDSTKDIVEALCNVLREKFETVHISLMPKSIFLFGPKVDVQNALHALKELLHIGTKGEMSAEERPFDLRVPSSTHPSTYGLYPSATNLVLDDKTTMDQSTSAANNSLPKDSIGQMSSDYPQYTKAEQRDREPVPEHREEDILKKDSLNLTQKMHDAQLSFKGEGPSDAHKALVSKLHLAPAEDVDLKSFRTRTQGVPLSLRVKEMQSSTPSLDISSQLLTRPKSETSQTLSANDLWSQTNDVDLQSTINQIKVFNEQKLDEALTKGNTATSFEVGARGESASNILGQCPWCQGEVNPYCSTCPRSETPAPQSSNEEHSGVNRPEERGLFCECGTRVESVTACGVPLCPECEDKVHSNCRVCPKSTQMVSGIRGTMACTEMSFSLSGHSKDTTLKLTYDIPDGIQGTDHPNPGAPFQGGKFCAFLPMNDITRKLLPSLDQAFSKGITFSVKALDTGYVVTWGRSVPHKTSIEGGISRNGFPDAGYLKRLAAALKSLGVEES